MARIPVTFTPRYDLYISNDIVHTASGYAPNTRTSVVLRDCECETSALTAELQQQCYDAYCAGQLALEKFVRAHFFPVGRAEHNPFWRDYEQQ